MIASVALGQTASLQLSSTSAAAGTTVPLALSLNTSSGTAPVALQWDFIGGTGVQAVTTTLGAAASSAGKSLTCMGTRCILAGMNTNTISNGIVASLNVTLAPTASGNVALQLSNLVATAGNATAISASGSPGTISVTSAVSVTVSPTSMSLSAGKTQQFTATVNGSGNTAVTWSLSSNVGTISSSGLYTAPATISTQQTVTVKATSVADASKSATATVTLLPPMSVTVTPTTVSLGPANSQQFTATVSGTSGTSVTWSLSSNVGTISSAGLYTAPATISSQQTITVKATSVTDSTKSASATVTLVPPITVSVAPTAISLSPGKTQQFTATVNGSSSNSSVTWALNPNVGTISSAGLYTAPGTISSQQNVTVTATSVADSSKSANAAITLVATVSSLVAAYPFNEGSGTTVTDVSGNGINGTIKNATWTSSGKYGKALVFNGSSALVTIADTALLHLTSAMTLEAWVNPSAISGSWRDVIYKGNDNYYLEGTSPSGSAPAIGGTFGSANTNVYSSTALAANTWTHLAATYDGATVRLYVNGTQVSSKSQAGNLASSTNPLQIGGDSLYGQYFNGTIDEVRIYSRALSQVEIQGDMNTPVAAITSVTSSLPVASPMAAGITESSQPASVRDKTARSEAAAGVQHVLSGLSCSPRMAVAGGVVTCALKMPPVADPLQVQLSSSADQVKIPAEVVTRPNQSSLTFEASIGVVAKSGSALITASVGDSQVQDSLLVMASGDKPVLMTPGKQIVKFGTAVDFTVSATDASGLPPRIEAKTLPASASFNGASGRFTWTPTAQQQGVHRIVFTASNQAGQSSAAEVMVDVSDGAPTLSADSLACSPNAIGTVTGKWLSGAETRMADPSGASMSLGGTQVKINGEGVPVLFSSSTKVNFLCPSLRPDSQISLIVETTSGQTQALTGQMQESTPRILSLDGSDGQALLSFPETGELAMARNYRIPAHPAQPGDQAVVWVTGLGSSENVPGAVRVNIGDVYAAIDSVQPVAGYAGLDAVYVRIPEGSTFGDAVPVQLTVFSSDGHLVRSEIRTVAIEAARY
ncbi:MAG TPA: LamG-like jellyroll fold domain-containing protein [Terriglobales bacterium]|nr:LamG-like jellyroll fold domain-containing protein [Terriglobales bacterium]